MCMNVYLYVEISPPVRIVAKAEARIKVYKNNHHEIDRWTAQKQTRMYM